MRYLLNFLVVFSLCVGVGSAIEEVTVKGAFEMQVDSLKPRIKLDFDKNSVLEPALKTDESMFDLAPDSLSDIKQALPSVVRYEHIISPYLINIISEPLIEFKIKVKEGFNVSKWNLIINDSQGALFVKISGKKRFPDIIEWSGQDERGNMVIPGRWYSYNIKIVDEFKEVFTVPGETFRFLGICYETKTKKVIGLAAEPIFGLDTKKVKIQDEGKLLLDEAGDILKEYYSAPIKVIVYDIDTQKAAAKAKKIVKYLSSIMNLDNTNVEVAGVAAYIAEYRVEIEILL